MFYTNGVTTQIHCAFYTIAYIQLCVSFDWLLT
jgi:hypothetical protein